MIRWVPRRRRLTRALFVGLLGWILLEGTRHHLPSNAGPIDRMVLVALSVLCFSVAALWALSTVGRLVGRAWSLLSRRQQAVMAVAVVSLLLAGCSSNKHPLPVVDPGDPIVLLNPDSWEGWNGQANDLTQVPQETRRAAYP